MFLDMHRVSLHRHYYRISLDQHGLYCKLDAAMTDASTAPVSEDEVESNLEKQQQYYEKREQAAVIGITFAGMCLEAFFYDYAASKLGDNFTNEHLDKLDLPSKLLIIPRLVCGKGVEKSSPVYEKVKRLSKDRNYLVHFKSKGFELTDLRKASEFHDALNERFRRALTNGIDAIRTVMTALGEIHAAPKYYLQLVCS